jgi:hypothetical protein
MLIWYVCGEVWSEFVQFVQMYDVFKKILGRNVRVQLIGMKISYIMNMLYGLQHISTFVTVAPCMLLQLFL